MEENLNNSGSLRASILSRAHQRCHAEGFARLRVADLCAELRIAKKSFYKHFSNKEDLVRALVLDHTRRYLPEALRVLDSDLPVESRVRQSLHLFFTRSAEHYSAVFLHDIKLLMPDLWTTMNQGRKALVQAFAQLIAEGQRDGTYRTDVDSERLSRVLALILDSVLDPQTLYQHGLSQHEVAPMLLDLIHCGLTSKESSP
jgi:AcrR family transcriptional regulator